MRGSRTANIIKSILLMEIGEPAEELAILDSNSKSRAKNEAMRV